MIGLNAWFTLKKYVLIRSMLIHWTDMIEVFSFGFSLLYGPHMHLRRESGGLPDRNGNRAMRAFLNNSAI